jgi:hypothetical protein
MKFRNQDDDLPTGLQHSHPGSEYFRPPNLGVIFKEMTAINHVQALWFAARPVGESAKLNRSTRQMSGVVKLKLLGGQITLPEPRNYRIALGGEVNTTSRLSVISETILTGQAPVACCFRHRILFPSTTDA